MVASLHEAQDENPASGIHERGGDTMLNDYRMTRNELINKALLLADDPLGQRFTSSQVIAALNDAMVEIALDVQLVREDLTILLREKQHLYEIHPRVATAGLRPYGYPLRIVYDVTTNAAISPFSTELYDLTGVDLAEENRPVGWRTDLYPHGEIAFFPVPSEEGDTLPALTGNVKLTYAAFPTAMDDEADYPDNLPAQYHEMVAVGAAMLLLEGGGTEEDLKLSAGMERELEQWKAKIIKDVSRGMTLYDSMRPM